MLHVALSLVCVATYTNKYISRSKVPDEGMILGITNSTTVGTFQG